MVSASESFIPTALSKLPVATVSQCWPTKGRNPGMVFTRTAAAGAARRAIAA